MLRLSFLYQNHIMFIMQAMLLGMIYVFKWT